ncbi:DUF2637 domain-containing protein [Nocardia sp. NPDC058658]|uniref:DUF2637 domain-containing protein n=1 Tax=Nocardia sp. NPDC058658 TaxID=3346580 RepID=UPI00365AFEE0
MKTVTTHHVGGSPHVRTTRAHVFFWVELVIAAGVSVAGNATHVLLHGTTLPAVAVVVAIIPPLALLSAVEGVQVLGGAGAGSSLARGCATTLTVMIAAAAFWLSFTALRALAIAAGVPASDAWLWPLIVEGSMAQSSIALLSIAYTSHTRDQPQSNTELPDLPAQPPLQTQLVGPADVDNQLTAGHRSATGTMTGLRTRGECEELALLVCERDRARRRDPAVVTQVLVRHHLDGVNASDIGRELGRSRSTISRILRVATELASTTTFAVRPSDS